MTALRRINVSPGISTDWSAAIDFQNVIAGIPVVRWKLYEALRRRFWGEGAGAAA